MQPGNLCEKGDNKIKDNLFPHSMNCRISTKSRRALKDHSTEVRAIHMD